MIVVIAIIFVDENANKNDGKSDAADTIGLLLGRGGLCGRHLCLQHVGPAGGACGRRVGQLHVSRLVSEANCELDDVLGSGSRASPLMGTLVYAD